MSDAKPDATPLVRAGIQPPLVSQTYALTHARGCIDRYGNIQFEIYPRNPRRLSDTVSVSFTEQAYEILEAAEAASSKGLPCSEWTLLVTGEGSIRMFADSDWPLDRLAGEHGARAAYRVSEHRGSLRVEARSGSRTCSLESRTPRQTARLLLGQ